MSAVNGRATLAQVAQEAGVSPSIASRVLNNYSELSIREETRERVIDAAARLQYRPHMGARSLRLSHAGAIGFLLPDLSDQTSAIMVRGAVEEAERRGMSVLVQEDGGTDDVVTRVTDLYNASRIDGLLIGSARPKHPLLPYLRKAGMPHVFVNRGVPRSGRNVILDDGAAARLAVDHLVALGHRHLAHVSGPKGNDPAARRTTGLLDAAAAHGLPKPLVIEAEFAERAGAAALEQVLSNRRAITAVVTGSLRQSIGLLWALRSAGVVVPSDVSVVALHDTEVADYLTPRLTTVDLPVPELGAVAVSSLAAQMSGGGAESTVVATAPRLVVRDSTGPAAS